MTGRQIEIKLPKSHPKEKKILVEGYPTFKHIKTKALKIKPRTVHVTKSVIKRAT